MHKAFLIHGIEVSTIVKTYELLASRGTIGILNERDQIYRNSIELFLQSPILGHGIEHKLDIYGSIST